MSLNAQQARTALLVVDVQNGFMPGGGLAVPHGDEVVPVINRISRYFENVVLTQDWHPADHISFSANIPDSKPYDVIRLSYGDQILWPMHCVQGTVDAEFHPDLDIPHAQLIIRKGFHQAVDSYSAFTEADRSTTTGLGAYLQSRDIRRLFICGLATDYCVAWTAMDARAEGFEAFVIEDACRGIDLDGSLARAWEDMHAAGVRRIQSSDLPRILPVK